ncbi:MAG: hypothetical protein J2P54_25160, partial [Bradyrhizobiaceae bacterium]|nr:hypothetical protein [Bradyrhizobiaceae bacterium]
SLRGLVTEDPRILEPFLHRIIGNSPYLAARQFPSPLAILEKTADSPNVTDKLFKYRSVNVSNDQNLWMAGAHLPG